MNEPDELSRLYREAARQEPSQALDEAILAVSRRAAGARPHVLRPTRRWAVPLALAATVVLTFSVTMMVREEQQADNDLILLPGPAPTTPETTPQPQKAKTLVAPPKPEAAAAPASGAMLKSAPAGQLAAPARQKSMDALRDTAPPAVPATQGTAENLYTAPAEAERRAPAPAFAPAPRSDFGAAQPALAPREERKSERSLEQSLGVRSLRGMSIEKPPEQWLAEIRALKRDGRAAEAADKLAEFKRLFPGYVLPEDLK